jgi:hypothetical protein
LVFAVIIIEKGALLVAVCIEITVIAVKYDHFGRLLVGTDELFQKNFAHLVQLSI